MCYCVAEKINGKKLVIFELKDIFYYNVDDDATREHIEKMGRVADCAIDKKTNMVSSTCNFFS